MNAMGYVKSLTILFLSGTLMLAFNNCSDVAFQQGTDGSVFKISDDVIDTNEIDGTEITEDNVQQYEESLEELANEQSSDDNSSHEEVADDSSSDSDSSSDDASDDSSSSDDRGAAQEETKKKSCDKKKRTEVSKKDRTDYESYKCKHVVGGIEAASAKKSVICHVTPSGVVLEKCLPQGAVRAHLEVVGRNPGHRVISGPCSQLEE